MMLPIILIALYSSLILATVIAKKDQENIDDMSTKVWYKIVYTIHDME